MRSDRLSERAEDEAQLASGSSVDPALQQINDHNQLSSPIGSPSGLPFSPPELLAGHLLHGSDAVAASDGTLPPPLDLLIAAACGFMSLLLERVMYPHRHQAPAPAAIDSGPVSTAPIAHSSEPHHVPHFPSWALLVPVESARRMLTVCW